MLLMTLPITLPFPAAPQPSKMTALEDDYYRKLSVFDLHLIRRQFLLGFLKFFFQCFLTRLRGFDKIL